MEESRLGTFSNSDFLALMHRHQKDEEEGYYRDKTFSNDKNYLGNSQLALARLSMFDSPAGISEVCPLYEINDRLELIFSE